MMADMKRYPQTLAVAGALQRCSPLAVLALQAASALQRIPR